MSALPPDAPTGETPAPATDAEQLHSLLQKCEIDSRGSSNNGCTVELKLSGSGRGKEASRLRDLIASFRAAPQFTPSSHARGVADDYVRQAGAELNLNRIEIARLRQESTHARGVALEALTAIRQRSVQAIGAGLSRRDWHATETAYNELRDRLDELLRQAPQPVRPGDGVREDRNAFLEQAGKALYEHEFGPECTNTEFPAWEATRGPLHHRYRRRAEVVLEAAGLLRGEGEAR